MNLITETINYFVSTLNMIWNSLAYIIIPGTGINGQFIFVFTLIVSFTIKFLLVKFAPSINVNTELPNNFSLKKKEQKYDNISNNKSKYISQKDLWW